MEADRPISLAFVPSPGVHLQTAALRDSFDLALPRSPGRLPAADCLVAPVGFLRDPAFQRSDFQIVIAYGEDRFMGWALGRGCADYLCEPWSLRQLECRIHSAFCRQGRAGTGFFFGRTWLRHGLQEVALSYHEYRILDILSRAGSEPVPRSVFLDLIWGLNAGTGRSLDVHVSRLRGKMRLLDPHGRVSIQCLRGRGYCLSEPRTRQGLGSAANNSLRNK